MNFIGKVALVTGGSKGLGKVIVKELAKRGCKVALCSKDKQALQATVEEITVEGGIAYGFQADLKNSDQINRLQIDVCTHFGRLDILINNLDLTTKTAP